MPRRIWSRRGHVVGEEDEDGAVSRIDLPPASIDARPANRAGRHDSAGVGFVSERAERVGAADRSTHAQHEIRATFVASGEKCAVRRGPRVFVVATYEEISSRVRRSCVGRSVGAKPVREADGNGIQGRVNRDEDFNE